MLPFYLGNKKELLAKILLQAQSKKVKQNLDVYASIEWRNEKDSQEQKLSNAYSEYLNSEIIDSYDISC